MISQPSKRGRRPLDFECPWDRVTINGLYRRPGTDVWKIRATGREFTEHDERRAVARFHELTAALPKAPVGKTRVVALNEESATALVLDFAKHGGKFPYQVQVTGEHIQTTELVDAAPIWQWVRDQIDADSKYAARQLGVEFISTRPAKADTLEAIGGNYFEHSTLSQNELSRSRCYWSEFSKVAERTGVTTVNGISHDTAAAYEKWLGERMVEGHGLAPKSRLHRYRKIRGILHFAIKRGKSTAACRQALDCLAMLEVKNAHPLDPTPISPDQFWAIYQAAFGADDRTFTALLLTALNAALYTGEVASICWDEIDFRTGGLVSRRSKTGVSRIAQLWPETLKAIKALPHDRDQVFCTKVRSYTVFSVGDRFEKYRNEAGVAAVTFSWIRDAAYSTAMEATSFEQAELLAGHRLPGTADAYLRRNPKLVAEACEAIRRKFNVAIRVKAVMRPRPKTSAGPPKPLPA